VLFGIVIQVQSSLAETDVTPEQFMGQIEGKIDVYSYPRIAQINGWARDTYFVQYYNKNTKHVIYLYLNDDLSVRDVEFRQYASPVDTIPDSVANDAVGKLRYNSAPIPDLPPVSTFYYTPTLPMIEERIEFNAGDSYDPKIDSYRWVFGDGKTAEGKVVNHLYSEVGNYTVKLTVTENERKENFSTKSIYVMSLPLKETESIPRNGTLIFKKSGIKEIIPKIRFDKPAPGNVTITKILGNIEFTTPYIMDIEVPENLKNSPGVITFQVPKKWIDQKSSVKEEVALYQEFEESWKELLPTEYIGPVGEEYEQYEAIASSLGGAIMVSFALPRETEPIPLNGIVIFKNPIIRNTIPKIHFYTPLHGNVTVATYASPKEDLPYIIIDIKVPESLKDSPAAISFQVSKEWVNQRGITKGDINLYHELEGGWAVLLTEYIGAVGEYERYEAFTPGFSSFMIRSVSKSNEYIVIFIFSVIASMVAFITFIFAILTYSSRKKEVKK
jgi:PKD repeat protein